MDADFNTPDALAVIFDLAREINTLRSLHEINGERATPLPLLGPDARPRPTQEDVNRYRRTLVHLLDVLGLDLESTSSDDEVPIAPFIALREHVQREAQLSSVVAIQAQGNVTGPSRRYRY